jgi:hypothetical protein
MRNRVGTRGIAATMLVLSIFASGCGETGSGDAGPVPPETSSPSSIDNIPSANTPPPRP